MEREYEDLTSEVLLKQVNSMLAFQKDKNWSGSDTDIIRGPFDGNPQRPTSEVFLLALSYIVVPPTTKPRSSCTKYTN